jgi:hypothetical protein
MQKPPPEKDEQNKAGNPSLHRIMRHLPAAAGSLRTAGFGSIIPNSGSQFNF